MTSILVVPVSKPEQTMTLELGEERPEIADGTANWEAITRPKRRPILSFKDESVVVQTVMVMLDRFRSSGDVEAEFRRIMAWSARNDALQPTLLRVYGPIYYPELPYILTKVDSSGRAIRDDAGRLVRQELSLELTEFVGSSSSAAAAPPAEAAQQRAAETPAQRTHVVKAGDTLWAIATRMLGNGNRYREIADLNDIRDPRQLRVGVTLRIPN